MKLEGYTNAEIAERRNRSERTIERKLRLIRKLGCTSMLNIIAAMTPWIVYKVVVWIQKVFAFLPSQTDTR